MHHDSHASVIARMRACQRRKNMRSGFLFHRFNFRGSPVNHENRENWLPRKFPAIRYMYYVRVIVS